MTISGAKERALLAMLLLNAGRIVPSNRLIDALWGDDPPESARKSLQVRIAGLRRALGHDVVISRPSGYFARVERDALDLDRFQRLVAESDASEPAVASLLLDQALELWRGPALADFEDEQWAAASIARLGELRLLAIEKRVDAYLALGRHDEVVADLRALVSEHPFREPLHARLMLALYRGGKQAEALAVFRKTRRIMKDELGIEPGSALVELERAILRQDESLAFVGSARNERSILVAALAEGNLSAVLAVAGLFARRPRRELILVRPNVARPDLQRANHDLQQRREDLRAAGVSIRTAVFTSLAPGRELVRVAAEQDVDLLLIDSPPLLVDDSELGHVLASAPCDVAVLTGGALRRGAVLVPFAGAEHDWSAIEIAAWLALAIDAPLQLAGPATGASDASRLLADASLAVQRALGVTAEPLILEPGPNELMRVAGEAGVVVAGLTDRWRTNGLGPVRSALATGRTAVLLVRRGLRPGGLAPAESYTRFTWTILPS